MKTESRWMFEAAPSYQANTYMNPYAYTGINRSPSLEFEWEAEVATCNNPLDARARSIIQAAQGATNGLWMRAIQVVWRIIGEYYPADAAKVSGVGWQPNLSGLETQRDQFAATGVIYGRIFVGTYFISNTNANQFARRVLQVGHELQHIDQYRRGITNQNEREFLAFYWAAMAQEKPGTGCLSHAMRRDLIDCAIGALLKVE
jgi:hypothetical protein